MAEVVRFNVAPVKSLALDHPEEIELTEHGVAGNRRFYLRSGGRLLNDKDCGALVRIRPSVDDGRLALAFPDGRVVAGEVALGERVTTNFWGHRDVHGHVVEGPWAAVLSAYVGEELQLVRVDEQQSAVDIHVGTLVSRASCERLGRELGAHIDARRFRMLVEVDGVDAHAEDEWDRVRIGDAVVRVRGAVPRCAVTTHDPDTGVPTLDTLRGIKRYRGLRDRRWIDFGVYFDVERRGLVRVGDLVQPL